MTFFKAFFFFICMAMVIVANAQEEQKETIESIFRVSYDTPLTLDLDEIKKNKEDSVRKKRKKEKIKKKVFFGYKTKKRFTKTYKKGVAEFEKFRVIKKYSPPPEYTRDFYWLDKKTKKVKNSLKVDVKRAQILHGPYKRIVDEQIIEQGWFYKGVKHKRWVAHSKSDILLHKSYWWKGWPQDSYLSYYDFEKTQLREMIPVHYGEKDGEYWAFHANGKIAAKGKFEFDNKIGMWYEYYPNRKIKREVQFPKNAFDKTQPIITREWNEKGKLLYEHPH